MPNTNTLAQRSPQSKSDSDADIIDLGALLRTVWRGKWVIAVITFLVMLASGYYAFILATPVYNSTSVVILETQEQQIVDLESVMSGFSGDVSAVNSEVEVLRSRSLMAKVVNRLDLTTDPEFNPLIAEPSAIDRLKTQIKNLFRVASAPVIFDDESAQRRAFDLTVTTLLTKVAVRNVPQSLVFQIMATTEEPQKSALLADTIADLYILNQLEVKFEATQQATTWLTDRVSELQVELETAEAKVSDFNSTTDLVSIESLQALERQSKDLRERASDAEAALIANQARLDALTAAANGPREEQAAAANDAQLSRFLTRMSGAEEATMAQAFDLRFEQLLARAGLEVARAETQFETLENSIAEFDIQITQQNQDLIELQQLTREAEASRLLYEYFLGRLKETSAQQGIQQADSRILSNAMVPHFPASPRKTMLVALAGVFGVFLGCGVVLLLELRQNTFRTARELEGETGYTVMGQLSLIPARRRRDALEYLADKPTSAAAEAVRNLRTSVLLSNVDTPPKVIMSTSSIPGEGKTTVSLALAQNLTGMNKKVLLVEGDIRRRVFGQYLDSDQKDGLLSVLSGTNTVDDVVIHDDRVGADVLIGEQTHTNAADVFSSEAFGRFMNEMRNKYDVIIVDTPPVLVVPDARIIAQSCDAILFTVKWDSTSKTQVEEALRLFESVGQRVSGLVLNQISARGMNRYGYGGKYGAYSAYGRKYYTN